VTIAVSIALSIYAGFPETAYIDGLLAVVWSFWRIVNVQAEFRFRFIMKLATGVIVGLLLSAPIIIPFVEYLGHSYIVGRSFPGLFKEAVPLLFFPWLYGSLCTSPQVFWVQGNVGGFLSATQLAVIVSGLFATRRCSLYIVLLLWILICMGRTFGLPLVSTLVDFVPLLKQTFVYRYSPPSWTFCSAVLCAIVINDISLGRLHFSPKIHRWTPVPVFYRGNQPLSSMEPSQRALRSGWISRFPLGFTLVGIRLYAHGRFFL
jgi:hypothetical protein